MSKDDVIEVEGKVVEVLPDTKFIEGPMSTTVG